MILHQLKGDYFTDDYEVTFVFEDDINTFGQFRQVFDSFNVIDSTYNNLKIDLYGRPLKLRRQRTMVTRVSKQSPLEISAFIEEHWLTLFLLYLTSYRDIKANIAESIKDADSIINSVENKLRELTDDFPGYEIMTIKNELRKILKWFNSLQLTEKDRILRQISRTQHIFRRIRHLRIKKRKTPHNKG